MIDEKKLIEDIKNLMIDSEELTGHSPGSVLHSVCEKVWEQPKVGEWIPVGKSLPEHSELCLVSAGNIVMTCPYCEIKFKEYGVTAWQPLPEPYREESAE